MWPKTCIIRQNRKGFSYGDAMGGELTLCGFSMYKFLYSLLNVTVNRDAITNRPTQKSG